MATSEVLSQISQVPEADPSFHERMHDLVQSRLDARDERGVLPLLALAQVAKILPPRAVMYGVAGATGLLCGTYAMLGINIGFDNHTKLTVTKANELVTGMTVGGADFCPVNADVRAKVDSYFTMEQIIHATVHGIGGDVHGPDEIWGVKSDMGLTGPACLDKKTGVQISKIEDEPVLGKEGKPTGEKEQAVYAELKTGVPISFHVSEKDPLADTFTNDDNEAAKLITLGGAALNVFPATGFLHPDATSDVHTLLHQVDLTAGVDTFVEKCGPKIMQATAGYVEDLVEDELFKEYEGFGIKRENIHMSMANLNTATYVVPYNSISKLGSVDELDYDTDLSTCEIAKDATIEVVE